MTTPQDLDERFRSELAGLVAATVNREPDDPVRDDTALTGAQARELYDAQSASRHLDLAARWLRSFNAGYYTIGSSGHEGNAAVAAALRPTDPALLHYRSGGFYCARAAQVADSDPVRDVLRGIVASVREPIAGGRHKVFGHPDLHIIPTTSTIASHLPRAVGIAYALGRGRRLNPPAGNGYGWPPDALVVCSFGDASVNHAAATAAFNTAGWCDHAGLRLPLLFVCEDNGIGISVRSPEGWVSATLRARPGLRYYAADGCDVAGTYDTAAEAAAWVRRHRRPAVLHLSTVRLMGHAGADAEVGYRTRREIVADVANDPLVRTARLLVDAGIATPAELMARYDEVGWEVRRIAEEVLSEPKLDSASEITAPLAPRRPVRVSRAISDAAARLVEADEDDEVYAAGQEEPAHPSETGEAGDAEPHDVENQPQVAGEPERERSPAGFVPGARGALDDTAAPAVAGTLIAADAPQQVTDAASNGPAPGEAGPSNVGAAAPGEAGPSNGGAAAETDAADAAAGEATGGGSTVAVDVDAAPGAVRAGSGLVPSARGALDDTPGFAAGGEVSGARGGLDEASTAAAGGEVSGARGGLADASGAEAGASGAEADGEIPGAEAGASTVEASTAEADASTAEAGGTEEPGHQPESLGSMLERWPEPVAPVDTAPHTDDEPPEPPGQGPEAATVPAGDGAARTARRERPAGNGHRFTRRGAFQGRLPERSGPLTLAQTINATLTDAMLTYPQMVVFGEDVAAKGGVYGVTKGLRDRFGATRVFDTLLDETSILGLALGSGLAGLLPVPEIQYLAYLHNAEDQLRGEAATMQFFSQGAYHNPMVVRIPGLAYQAGFGGHFHNDNAVAVLRDIPGLVVAVPARPEDAAPMLRTCLASALVDGSVCAFLEPIALYHTRDLYTDDDRWWLSDYAPPSEWSAIHVPIGRARVYTSGPSDDLTIITFGNGVRLSLRAAARLAADGIGSRVVDLRWLSPLPVADIIRESAVTGRVLVVDETRRSGGVGEGVLAALVDAGYVGVARRVASVDSFIPLGPAARHVLVSEEQIVQGARSLLAR